jgi:F-type H+-transporting ATPase subunit b
MHIDWWTLALQAVNLLVLVWLLNRVFYRPVANIVQQRQAAASSLLADAAAARAGVEAEKAGIAATRAQFAAERDALLAEAARQAQAERDAILKQAGEEVAHLRAGSEAELARDRTAMEHALIRRAASLAVEISRKLLEKIPPGVATMSSVDALRDRFQALPAPGRTALIAAASAGGIEVITAAPMNDTDREQCRSAIEAMLGSGTRMSYRCDPALIAGIEIRSSTIILRNSWRDDLSQILGELESR